MSPLPAGIRKRLIAYGTLLGILLLLATFGYWLMFLDPGGHQENVLEDDSTAPINKIAENLEKTVRHLAITIGPRNLGEAPQQLQETRNWLRAQLEQLGYEVNEMVYEETTSRFAKDPASGHFRRQEVRLEVAHLEAELPGRSLAEEIVLVGAHYDSVEGTPGANDNASGVAATLELARLLQGARFERTIRFVFFVNEEPPYFDTDRMGSRIYARHCHERGDKIHAMFSLETMGYYSDEPGSQRYPALFEWFYPDRGNFVGVVGNLGSRWLVRRTTRLLREATRFPVECCATWGKIPGIFWSDHASFWPYGWPAVMISDSAYFRDPQYHQSGDTPDRLDYGALARISFALRHVLSSLATEESP